MDLDDYRKKLQILEDRVVGVAEGYQAGLYLLGRPGTGKTHTVKGTLDRLGVSAHYANARLSPAALFDMLGQHPDRVHVIDDVPELWKSPEAKPILMAALGGKGGEARRVDYRLKGDARSVEFRGGIIAISNVPQRQDPGAKALASRTVFYEFAPTDDELAAHMRHLAAEGFDGLTPAEAGEVCEFVLQAAAQAESRPDLRTFEKGCADYRLWRTGKVQCSWHVLIQSSLRPVSAGEIGVPLSRDERMTEQDEVVEALYARFPYTDQRAERAAEWERLTGASEKNPVPSCRRLEFEDQAAERGCEMSAPRVYDAEKYKGVFPHRHTAEELEELGRAICEEGRVHTPIVVDENDCILDGFARHAVVVKHGIKHVQYHVTVCDTEADKRRLIVKLNVQYRRLSAKQRREVVGGLLAEDPGRANRLVGTLAGVDKNTVRSVRAELEAAGTIPPAAERRGLNGVMKPAKPKAKVVTAMNLREAQAATAAIRAGVELKSPTTAARTVKRTANRLTHVRDRASPGLTPPEGFRLMTGKSEEQEWPTGIDLILTDPLYQVEHLGDWDWLARFAKNHLKPGGFLVAYTGTMTIPNTMAALGCELTYQQLGTVHRPNAGQNSTGPYIDRCRYVLIYSNGKARPRNVVDNFRLEDGEGLPESVYHCPSVRKKADLALGKDAHDYQQHLGGVIHWLWPLTRPGDLVADPFGGGFTTAVAAKLMGRQFVGCDSKQANVDRGLHRLNDLESEKQRLTAKERKKYRL